MKGTLLSLLGTNSRGGINVSCKCQECGRQYKVDILVPDDIWEKIKPKNKPVGGGLLCGVCIINSLEKIRYSAWRLVKII